jgi:hypothetical protein
MARHPGWRVLAGQARQGVLAPFTSSSSARGSPRRHTHRFRSPMSSAAPCVGASPPRIEHVSRSKVPRDGRAVRGVALVPFGATTAPGRGSLTRDSGPVAPGFRLAGTTEPNSCVNARNVCCGPIPTAGQRSALAVWLDQNTTSSRLQTNLALRQYPAVAAVHGYSQACG